MPYRLEDLNYEKDSKERMPWEYYLNLYKDADPMEIAQRLAIPYDEGSGLFLLRFYASTYQISWPDFTISHVADDMGYYPLEDMIYARILVMRFLLNGVASKGSGSYKTYREMPWGEVYLRQFDGRCIKRLAFSYGNRLEDFCRVMEHVGARKVSHGDAGYTLEIFDGYEIQMLLWEGDDEFPPSAQFLFSDNFPLSFSAEDLAQMGDVVIGAMKRFNAVK
ncbi:MAG: DUF3786 domain-containing protein [Blautia sp.]|nr:DUF3786 domain-containing protein [Blautia sp.]